MICLTFIDAEDRVKRLGAALTANSTLVATTVVNLMENLYSPGWHWLTVQDIRAQKHIAARQVQRFHAREADELVVFGDNTNDLSIFSIADRCYAVGNAAQVVLDAATGIIGSNDDDAVVRFIQNERDTP